jgi:EF hand domain-containing protein
MRSLRLCALAVTVFAAAFFVQAAEGLPGATVRPEAGAPAPERQRMQEWCKANPEKCKEMQAKMKERQEQCKADPEKCRAEMQAKGEERFKAADTDKDGKLTRAEAEKGMPMVARRFEQIDVNKDGFVTKEELEAARKARAAQRKDKST